MSGVLSGVSSNLVRVAALKVKSLPINDNRPKIVATSLKESQIVQSVEKAFVEYGTRFPTAGIFSPLRVLARQGEFSSSPIENARSFLSIAHMVGLENATKKFLNTMFSEYTPGISNVLNVSEKHVEKGVEIFSCVTAGVLGAVLDQNTVSKEKMGLLSKEQKNSYLGKLCLRNFGSIAAFQSNLFEDKKDNDMFQRFLYGGSRLIDVNAQSVFDDKLQKAKFELKLTSESKFNIPRQPVSVSRNVFLSLVFFELNKTVYDLINNQLKK